MSYVPVIVPPTASARAEDLAKRLEQSLAEYRRQNPSTSESDVRQALDLVARRQASGTNALLLVIGAGLLLLLGIASFVFWVNQG